MIKGIIENYKVWKEQPMTNGSFLTIMKRSYQISLLIYAVWLIWWFKDEISEKVSGLYKKVKPKSWDETFDDEEEFVQE